MSIRFLIYFIVISFFTIQEISSQINWYDTDPESIHNYLNSQFKGEIEKVKTGNEKHTTSKKRLKKIPAILSKYILNTLSFLMYSLNFHSKQLP